MRRWRVSLRARRRPSLLALFLFLLFVLSPRLFILHRTTRKRGRFGPITTRLKSYVEFICRRPPPRAARRDTTRYSSRPNPRTRARANDGGNILSLFNLAALVRRAAPDVYGWFLLEYGERAYFCPRAIFFSSAGSRWSWLLKDGSVKKGTRRDILVCKYFLCMRRRFYLELEQNLFFEKDRTTVVEPRR